MKKNKITKTLAIGNMAILLIEFDKLEQVSCEGTKRYFNVIKDNKKIAFLSTNSKEKVIFVGKACKADCIDYRWYINVLD